MDLEAVDQSARAGQRREACSTRPLHKHGEAQAMEHHGRRWTHEEVRRLDCRTRRRTPRYRSRARRPNMLLFAELSAVPRRLDRCVQGRRPISPVNPQYKRREVAYQLEDTDASAIVTHPALREVVDQAIEDAEMEPEIITIRSEDWPRDDADRASTMNCAASRRWSIVRTTTWPCCHTRPGRRATRKASAFTHENNRAQLMGGDRLERRRRARRGHPQSHVAPLYHITGFTHGAPAAGRRRPALLPQRLEWDAQECMQLIEDEWITHFVGVTTMYADMVESDDFGEYDLSSLESASEGGAKLSTAVQERFEETAGVDISEGYGSRDPRRDPHPERLDVRPETRHDWPAPADDRLQNRRRGGGRGRARRGRGTRRPRPAGDDGVPQPSGRPPSGPSPSTATSGLAASPAATGTTTTRSSTEKHMINTAGYNVYPSAEETLPSTRPSRTRPSSGSRTNDATRCQRRSSSPPPPSSSAAT